jgi:hypothetical protein
MLLQNRFDYTDVRNIQIQSYQVPWFSSLKRVLSDLHFDVILFIGIIFLCDQNVETKHNHLKKILSELFQCNIC